MDTKEKKKWVKALRSGKYAQTTGALRDKKGFCCLGVFCDISGKGKWINYFSSSQDGDFTFQVGNNKKFNGGLPYTWLSKKKQDVLTEMNDENEDNFATIADYIEKEL